MSWKIAAILLAAGRGKRMGAGQNKLLIELCGEPVICHAVRALKRAGKFERMVFVHAQGEREACEKALASAGLLDSEMMWVVGGEERQQSVKNALDRLPDDIQIVLIHDGARPFVTSEMVKKSVHIAAQMGACACAVPAKDTVKEVDENGVVTRTLNRATLWMMQTPQTFRKEIILKAHQQAQMDRFCGTDDAMLVERIGVPMKVIMGSYENIKITTPEDILAAEAILDKHENTKANETDGAEADRSRPVTPQEEEYMQREMRAGKGTTSLSGMRVGLGTDAHRLVQGSDLVLGGVKIEHEKGLLGHSDADVLTHAVMDALLGAAGLRDIGVWFPDSDEQYRGANSLELLEKVAQMLHARGCRIINVDATVVCQAPKLAAHIQEMENNIAKALKLEEGCVNVKATTTEGMGPEGRGEGISAQAIALIQG